MNADLYPMKQLKLNSPDGASATIYLQGAHLASWKTPNGKEQLFLSQTSEFASGKALRGGVPIIFPQFANRGTIIKHGFARTALWQVVASGKINEYQSQAILRLTNDTITRAIWPHAFSMQLRVIIGGDDLQLELQILNTGNEAIEFTNALHTYFAVDSLQDTLIHGLDKLDYLDSVQQQMQSIQDDQLLRKDGTLHIHGEVDRIYPNFAAAAQTVQIQQAHQTALIEQKGFSDLVLWNPGAEKAVALTDLEIDGYQRFVCVEAANAINSVRLEAGDCWIGTQKIQIREHHI